MITTKTTSWKSEGGSRRPLVSIGMPVYNGENFVADAIKSIQRQSLEDFELIISDNASDDRTPEICSDFAANDRRIRYYRNEHNLGASKNYARVFELRRAHYFKWAAHDDVCEPNFLERCMEVLVGDPSVVLCFTQASLIDVKGHVIRGLPAIPALNSEDPVQRFRGCLNLGEQIPIWGVMRANAMTETRLLGPYQWHDIPFLAELALLGRFHMVPQRLFHLREHARRSVRLLNPDEVICWYDPTRLGKTVFPHWRLLLELLRAVLCSPPALRHRLACVQVLACWTWGHLPQLFRDLVITTRRVPIVGPTIHRTYTNHQNRAWVRQAQKAVREAAAVIPRNISILLVDDGAFDSEALQIWRIECWGIPENGSQAIESLEDWRRGGARFLVFTWPAFWWFDFFPDLTTHIRERYRVVFRSNSVIIFSLKLHNIAGFLLPGSEPRE